MNIEKFIKILSTVGIILAGLGETLKQYNKLQENLDKQSSNKINDYKSAQGKVE